MRKRPRLPAPDLPPQMLRARRIVLALAAVAAVATVSVCAWLAHFALDDLRYSSGLTGTSGTYTASHCTRPSPSGHGGAPKCVGEFVPRDGGPVERGVTYDDSYGVVSVGRPTSFDRSADGGHHPVGAIPVAYETVGTLLLVLACAGAVTGLSAARIQLLTSLPRAAKRRIALFTAALATAIGLVAAALYLALAAVG